MIACFVLYCYLKRIKFYEIKNDISKTQMLYKSNMRELRRLFTDQERCESNK